MGRVPQLYYNVSENVPAWARIVGETFSFTADRAQGTVVWNIPDDSLATHAGTYLQQFARDALGYSVIDPDAQDKNAKIKRFLPARHPRMPWLFASQMSARPVGDAPDGDKSGWQTDALKQRATNVIGVTEPVRVGAQLYKLWECTVAYESPPWTVLTNAATSKEWQRFTVWRRTPTIEFVQADRGFFQFPPGTGDATARGIGKGKMANKVITKSGGLALRKVKVKIEIDWIGVPDIGLFGLNGQANGGQAFNQDDGMGLVNNAAWPGSAGYPRGTLLLEGWNVTPHTMVNLMDYGDELTSANQPLRSWDVHFSISHFNPPFGQTDAQGNPIRGHNLVPSPEDGFWYRALLSGGTKVGTVAQPKFPPDDPRGWKYQEYDFDKLFRLNIR